MWMMTWQAASVRPYGAGNIIVAGYMQQNPSYSNADRTPTASTFGDVLLSNIGMNDRRDAVVWKLVDNTFEVGRCRLTPGCPRVDRACVVSALLEAK